MHPPKWQAPLLTAVLLVIGAAAIALAFWLSARHPAPPGWGGMIAGLFGLFFVSSTWALLRYLRRRDRQRAAHRQIVSATAAARSELDGTVYGLIAGRQYRVLKSFTDFHGGGFEQGELLRFKQRHFLPYHGGHTIVFEEHSLFLQEEQSREILDNFSQYIAPAEP